MNEIEKLKAENEKLKRELENKEILLDVAVSKSGKTGTHAEIYYTALQEIQRIILNQVSWVGQITREEQQIIDIINKIEV